FQQDGDLRAGALSEFRLDGGDAPLEKYVAVELQAELLAEVELLAIEVEEADLGAVGAPVAEAQLGAIEPLHALADHHAQEALGEGKVFLPVDEDGRARGSQSVAVCGRHRSPLVRPEPQRALHLAA